MFTITLSSDDLDLLQEWVDNHDDETTRRRLTGAIEDAVEPIDADAVRHEGYREGYDEGHEDGYQNGYADGEERGYDIGYDCGYSDGIEQANREAATG